MTSKLMLSIVALIFAATLVQSPDVEELQRLESVWNEAHLHGDTAALDSLWSEELIVTVPGMAPMSKTDSIGIWKAGRMKFQKYSTSEIRIRLYDNAAVVTGRVLRSRDLDGRVSQDDWRFTKVYLKRAGKWRVIAYHASPVAL